MHRDPDEITIFNLRIQMGKDPWPHMTEEKEQKGFPLQISLSRAPIDIDQSVSSHEFVF